MERQDALNDMIGVRIDRDLRDDLVQLANAESRTLSNYIRLVLVNHVAVKKAEEEAA